jgi:hypothetical protein
MTGIQTWLVALLTPSVLFGANWGVRQALSLPRSVPADAMITLALFQFAIIADPHPFQAYVRSGVIQNDIILVFAFLMVFTICSWSWLLVKAEKTIHTFELYTNRKEFIESECGLANCRVKSHFAGKVPHPWRAYFLAFFLPLASAAGTLCAFLLGG